MANLIVWGYSGVQPIFCEGEEELAETRKSFFVHKPSNLIALAVNPMFPERADYVPTGFARVNGDIAKHDLGSREDYAAFKETICKKFREQSLAQLFEEPTPGPFFELLYFQDLGKNFFLGPHTCAKLLEDFSANRHQAEGLPSGVFQRYARIQELLKLAQKTGVIRFDWQF